MYLFTGVLKYWERIYSKKLPAAEATTDKPISLSDIYFLLYYTVAGLCATIVLFLSEICFRRLSIKTHIFIISAETYE